MTGVGGRSLSKQFRLAVEMEEERRARLENDAATKWLGLAMETDEERKARLEKMVITKQLRLAMETDVERKARLEKMVGSGWPWRQRKKKELDWISQITSISGCLLKHKTKSVCCSVSYFVFEI